MSRIQLQQNILYSVGHRSAGVAVVSKNIYTGSPGSLSRTYFHANRLSILHSGFRYDFFCAQSARIPEIWLSDISVRGSEPGYLFIYPSGSAVRMLFLKSGSNIIYNSLGHPAAFSLNVLLHNENWVSKNLEFFESTTAHRANSMRGDGAAAPDSLTAASQAAIKNCFSFEVSFPSPERWFSTTPPGTVLFRLSRFDLGASNISTDAAISLYSTCVKLLQRAASVFHESLRPCPIGTLQPPSAGADGGSQCGPAGDFSWTDSGASHPYNLPRLAACCSVHFYLNPQNRQICLNQMI